MPGGASAPDPYVLRAFGASDNFAGISWRATAGLSVRSPTINPAIKTGVLLVTGQSIAANTLPTLYTPTNASVVDQMNIFDGQLYNIGGPLLGSSRNSAVGGPGNLSAMVADLVVTNGKFDRVILCCMTIGSTTASMWGDANAEIYLRTQVAMARLAARGVVPGMTGVTFFCLHSLGETDCANGTLQAPFAASSSGFIAKLNSTGFNGRIFIPQETYQSGVTSNPIRAAQASLWDGSTVFSGGDIDTLTVLSRQADNTHLTDAGAVSAATLIYNAMHASGAPF